MKHIYVVKITATDEEYYYTTKSAIAEAHGKHDLKIAPATIRELKMKSNIYRNRFCTIRKVELCNKSDVIKFRNGHN